MENRLSRIDLNLLIALQTLIEERNVTRAAERLFITQPAMSKTLQRLRDLFDDPLFTRTSHGLIPTPKTEQLQAPLIKLLDMMHATIFSAEFDPATAEGTIHISVPETVAVGVIPMLLKRIHYNAPNVQLQTRNILDDHLDLMTSGTLDFSIYIQQEHKRDFEFYPLGTNSAVCWIREGHPLAEKEVLDCDDILNYPHVAIYLPNITDKDMLRTERIFRDAGIFRNTILETTQLLTALEVLSLSDSLMLGPTYLAEFHLTRGHFVSKPFVIPELNELKLSLSLIQHRRTMHSPLHNWIKGQIFEIFESVSSRVNLTGVPDHN